ncbi:SDR family oxidoreductase [Bacillus solimangrovi]|uniref:NAD-dependent dehydratase n=1 Tax=Bacillus solimangrovi TaxID=1305675 RepID=A0A1E5LG52_9BACI|nr:SDR family oxidoreductase [Bacillus solimangrovi]OEH93052.1 NAD-dependent dehydratase [Bacillus solimangrovi]
MKVLVIGANGKIAKRAIEFLKEEGHEPVAMLRNTDQIPHFEKLGVKTVIADLEKDFSHAYYGVDAVMFAAGSGPHTGLDKTIVIDQEGAISAIDLANRFGVKRFILLSSMSADEPKAGPKALQPYLYAKGRADAYLRTTNLNYTIVRPGPLTNEIRTDNVLIESKIQTSNSKSIPREDVARLLAITVAEENTYRRTFDVLSGETEISDALHTF